MNSRGKAKNGARPAATTNRVVTTPNMIACPVAFSSGSMSMSRPGRIKAMPTVDSHARIRPRSARSIQGTVSIFVCFSSTPSVGNSTISSM